MLAGDKISETGRGIENLTAAALHCTTILRSRFLPMNKTVQALKGRLQFDVQSLKRSCTGPTRRLRLSQGLFGARNFQLLADRADRAVLNFSVTRNAGDLSLGRIQPDGVTATLALKDATLFAEMALQVDPFHGSGNSIGSRTA